MYLGAIHSLICAIVANSTLCDACGVMWQRRSFVLTRSDLSVPQDLISSLLPRVLPAVTLGLQDLDDDVRAVAASALIPVVEGLVQLLSSKVRKSPLVKTLTFSNSMYSLLSTFTRVTLIKEKVCCGSKIAKCKKRWAQYPAVRTEKLVFIFLLIWRFHVPLYRLIAQTMPGTYVAENCFTGDPIHWAENGLEVVWL